MTHYHLIGICGTAMASLAGMLKARGHDITGSDAQVYPPMSDELARLGIPVNLGYDPVYLARCRPDVVVVGNAIPRGNPEVEYVLEQRWRYASLPEVLKQEFLWGRRVLVVTGTHGKTTTTALAAHVLTVGGLEPTFLVGGIAENFGSSFRVTESDYVVLEGDEYDTAYFDKGPKFMHYLPEIGIINNVEFDHADIYANLEAVKLAFRRFVNLIPRNGACIVGFDAPHARDVAAQAWAPVEGFALDAPDALWRAHDLEYTATGMRFSVSRAGIPWATFELPIFGAFNIRNALAVIAAAIRWGIPPERIAAGLSTFRAVKRRMEVRGEIGSITVVDDFAHHPTAVRETLNALAHRFPGRPLTAVFEPRSWSSRKRVFQAAYAEAFGAARQVVIAPVFEPAKIHADDRFSPEQLCADLTACGKTATVQPSAEAIVDYLLEHLQPREVIAILSNGGFDGLHDKLLRALKAVAKDDTH
ncbi:MAG: UDP-N-acetylmuramate:L-alanyl-gamma-D-glutamyl-meso-diaminopimelate ligase [Acidobacteriota bacterium]